MKIIEEKSQEINEILEALKNCYFDEGEDYCFDDDIVRPFAENYHKPFQSANGATKGVLIFPSFGFVIKIPFIYCDGETMCGAEDGLRNWDYCSQEVTRWEMADDEGFGEVFLETEYLTDVNHHPIYIQPYAEILSSMCEEEYNSNHCSSKDEDKETVMKINQEEEYDYINSSWEADLLVRFGITFYKKFKTYIKENMIDDLRTPNIGYIGKTPVLVDYAGFNN